MLSLFPLASCQSVEKSSPLVVPSSFFKCKDEPKPLTREQFYSEGADQIVARYNVEMRSAGEDCRKRLSITGNYFELQQSVIVTDTIVTEQKEKKKLFGPF